MHFNWAYHPAYCDLLEHVQDDPPDLILITGDFIESKVDLRPAWPMVERFVSGLRSRGGIFTVTGNHDGDLLSPRLASLGVRVITTDALRLDIDGAPLELIGLAGVKRRDLRDAFLQSLPPKRPDTPRIVLAHFPDLLRRIGHLRADVILAGHTHGGQVCLPGGIPIIRHDKLPRRYASGVHRIGTNDETWLVVSRGMGFSKYAIRLFCPAEVVEITLTSAARATSR
jgi:predicted MPP superfamily phosphohydrolase